MVILSSTDGSQDEQLCIVPVITVGSLDIPIESVMMSILLMK